MTFPEKFEILRRLSRKSQQRVADDIGVSRATVGNWSRGEFTPNLVEAAQLARLFGVSLDFLGFDEIEELPEATIRRLMAGSEATVSTSIDLEQDFGREKKGG